MRQTHRAGEKVFVDYAGPTIPIVDPTTGEIFIEACVFVGVLGASNYTFAEATKLPAHSLYRIGCKAMFICLSSLVVYLNQWYPTILKAVSLARADTIPISIPAINSSPPTMILPYCLRDRISHMRTPLICGVHEVEYVRPLSGGEHHSA